MLGNCQTPFIEDYIQLMEKDEHIVFKCPYNTLSKDVAKAFSAQAGSFVYFYIYLNDAKES